MKVSGTLEYNTSQSTLRTRAKMAIAAIFGRNVRLPFREIDVTVNPTDGAGPKMKRERLAFDLWKTSWDEIFAGLHRAGTHINSHGNFWAAVQELERQFCEATGEPGDWCSRRDESHSPSVEQGD